MTIKSITSRDLNEEQDESKLMIVKQALFLDHTHEMSEINGLPQLKLNHETLRSEHDTLRSEHDTLKSDHESFKKQITDALSDKSEDLERQQDSMKEELTTNQETLKSELTLTINTTSENIKSDLNSFKDKVNSTLNKLTSKVNILQKYIMTQLDSTREMLTKIDTTEKDDDEETKDDTSQ